MDRKRTSNAVQRKKSCLRSDASDVDRFEKLRDLIMNIVSFLTVSDMINVCCVYPGWMGQWVRTTQSLNLPIPQKTKFKVARDFRNYWKIYESEILEHTQRVDHSLKSHQALHLDELKIGAYRDTCELSQVHSWIKFAIQKGVKTFELVFNTAGRVPMSRCSFLKVEDFANLLDGSERHLHHPSRAIPEKHQLRSFCCLQSISLGFFDVSDEIIGYFLKNCMFLEFLRVEFSDTLLSLEVVDGVRLKCLEIIRCLNFRSLKISSRNLVSLVYIGPNIDVPFKGVSCNSLELTIGDQYGESFALEQSKHATYLSMLETVNYAVSCKVHVLLCRAPFKIAEMKNLKHLALKVPIGKSLMGYTTFFIAAPRLVTFKMEYSLRRSFEETEEEFRRREEVDKLHETSRAPHQHLQMVELIGFHNQLPDIRFATHLIKMAVDLKKMVLRFRHHSGHAKAMSHVNEVLREEMPPGVELVMSKTTGV